MDFDDNLPIYEQVKQAICNMILSDDLKAHDKIPSTNEMVRFYKINHITISKGISQLVDANILYKKRGIGMFVEPSAKEVILKARQEGFKSDYLNPMLKEAKKLNISKKELIDLIKEDKSDE